MPNAAAHFMREWLRTHVVSNEIDVTNAGEVEIFVDACKAEAEAKGISVHGIEDTFGDTIEELILRSASGEFV